MYTCYNFIINALYIVNYINFILDLKKSTRGGNCFSYNGVKSTANIYLEITKDRWTLKLNSQHIFCTAEQAW